MLTEQEEYFAELVISVIDHVECPMLMYEGEKAVVRRALKELLSRHYSEKMGR